MTTEPHKEIYRELMAEMRWRKDQDGKYLTLFFAVCAFILAGVFTVLTKVDDKHTLIIILSSARVVIVLVAVACALKIWREHIEYASNGKAVVRILEQWKVISEKLDPPLEDTKIFTQGIKRLGTGAGWLYSVGIMAVFTLSMCAFVNHLMPRKHSHCRTYCCHMAEMTTPHMTFDILKGRFDWSEQCGALVAKIVSWNT